MRPAPQLAPLDLDTIRRLWKPRRDSYADARLYEENRIRLHRAFSWLERAERCGEPQLDDRYLAQWAALMALASRWDEGRGAPVAERTALAAFVRQVFATDHDGVMPATLERERALVASVFSDRYLARHFDAVDARALLERKRVVFEEIDIDRDPALREQMIARSGRRTVPQIFVGDVHVGGCDDLHALDAQGGLDPLLVSQEAQNHG